MNIAIFFFLGFLTSLLFPPYFFLPLGFLIFPIICFFIEKNKNILKLKNLFQISFSFAFAFFLSFLSWIKNPFYIFEETKNLFFISILLIILLALIFCLVFTLIFKFNKIIPIIFLIPLIFITFEYIVSIILSGFPWITFSIIFSNIGIFSFVIKNFGTLISSYIIIQVFCLPYFLLMQQPYKIKNLYHWIIIILPLLLALSINFTTYDNKKNMYTKISLEIFQLNNSVITTQEDLKKRLNIIIDYVSNSNADVLIFGENNYPYLIKDDELKFIQNYLKKNQTLIIGGTRIEDRNYYNSLLNIKKDSIFSFDKKILVPFGEFLPLRKYLYFFEPISGQNDYKKGKQDRLINFDKNISYIPVICYEMIFYWKLINNLNQDAEFVVNITNDIWFGKLLGPYQHFYLTKIRAAEFNKPIIRVSNNGISGIINENGKVLINTELNKKQVIQYTLNLRENINFYKSHFYLKLYFFVLCFLLIIINVKKRNARF